MELINCPIVRLVCGSHRRLRAPTPPTRLYAPNGPELFGNNAGVNLRNEVFVGSVFSHHRFTLSPKLPISRCDTGSSRLMVP